MRLLPEWKVLRLGDILKLKSGISRPADLTESPDEGRRVPVYGGNGISGYTSQIFSEEEHLVIGRVGEYCGCVHIASAPNWITDNALYSEKWFIDDIDIDFLAKCLSYLDLNRFRRKAGQPLITQGILHELTIMLPPKNEQRAIARVLRAVQEAKEARLRELALERERKAALMEHLFTHGTRGEPTKQTEIGEMPESWEISPLSHQIQLIDCKHMTPKYMEYGIPIIRPRNIKADGISFNDTEFVSEEDFQLLTEKHIPRRGDIIYSRNASFGIPSFVDTDRRFCIGQDTIVMTHKIANTKYIFYALCSNANLMQLRKFTSGSTIHRINLENIRRLLIPVPLVLEQNNIVEILSAFDSKIAALEREIELHDELFRATLEELMTGRLSARGLIEEASPIQPSGP